MYVYAPSFVLQFLAANEFVALVISSLHIQEQKGFFQYLVVFCCRRSRGRDDENNSFFRQSHLLFYFAWFSAASFNNIFFSYP